MTKLIAIQSIKGAGLGIEGYVKPGQAFNVADKKNVDDLLASGAARRPNTDVVDAEVDAPPPLSPNGLTDAQRQEQLNKERASVEQARVEQEEREQREAKAEQDKEEATKKEAGKVIDSGKVASQAAAARGHQNKGSGL